MPITKTRKKALPKGAHLAKEDLIQILDKETGRYVKMDKLGNVIAVKTTDGPYKGILVRQRRPSKKRAAKKKAATKTVKKATATKKAAAPKKKAAAPKKAPVKKAAPKKKVAKKKAAPKPKKPRKVNYLNNKDLMAEVLKSKEQDAMTDKLAHMLQTLAARYGKKGNFANYTYNEDMQAYAMLMLVKTWRSFNPEKSQNPFAFFTQCIKNSFIQYLNQERRQRDVRDVLLVDKGLSPSYTFQMEHEARMKEHKEVDAHDQHYNDDDHHPAPLEKKEDEDGLLSY